MLVKDASLGGKFPVMCVTLMNPRTGGVFASFGAHPSLEIALERSLTELLQGRSFEGLNDLPRPTFESNAVTEPNNFVEHFIDSSGVVSWRFFSAKADHEFVEWDFSGHGENSNAEEAAVLFGILKDLGKEAYMAVYDTLGGSFNAIACRILVPGYSEIYPVEDLIWDNTNKALLFRADILNLHRLDDAGLQALLERLEDSELDDQTDIITLIGIEFDENTAWGQLTILELKLLIHLALKQFESAQELVQAFLQYNENTVERGLFYQALNVVLEVVLDDDLELNDYVVNFRRMFGDVRMDAVLASVDGSVRFFGLSPTSMKLEGLDRHQRLIDSYKKLHRARAVLGGKKLAANAQRFEDSGALDAAVAVDQGAIGFVGLPYVKMARALAIADGRNTVALSPTVLTVKKEDYALSRRLFLYTATKPSNAYVRQFVHFAQSEAGQQVVKAVGFVDQNLSIAEARQNKTQSSTRTCNLSAQWPGAKDAYCAVIKGKTDLGTNFRFRTGSSELDNRAIQDLQRLLKLKADNAGGRLTLIGFADAQGKYEINRKLSESRANAVRAALRTLGIDDVTCKASATKFRSPITKRRMVANEIVESKCGSTNGS